MKRIIAILITFLMLLACSPLESVAKEKDKKKKKAHKKSWIYRFLHKRHDREQLWNSGHTEFKNRPKKEQKKISRHHLDPNKKLKESKKDKQKKKDESKGEDKGKGKDAPEESPQEPEPQEPAPQQEAPPQEAPPQEAPPQEAPPSEPPAPTEPPKEEPK